MTWTTEQIVALAPDASSAKHARGLANERTWETLGSSGTIVWGECKGSGKTPYQVRLDVSSAEPGYKCTCPSRKIPCKHTLGLFLLFANQPEAFTESAPPPWVAEWLEKRTQSAQRRQKNQEHEAVPGQVRDPAAQQRRAAERQAKVDTGMHELERWLHDLVRHGLADVQGKPASFWEKPATHMADAQAETVARFLRKLSLHAASSSADAMEHVLERLGWLYLLIEGYKRLDTLTPETQEDIRTLIGWARRKDELVAEQPALRDTWYVIGQYVEEDYVAQIGRSAVLRTQRIWLWGQHTHRAALLLHFAHGNNPFEINLMPGMALDAELVFYPGGYPLRALIKTRLVASEEQPAQKLDAYATIEGYMAIDRAIAAYADALGQNPWLERFPLVLQSVVPIYCDGAWAIRDEAGHILPILSRFERGWQLMALSGGHPVVLSGEWDGQYLMPLSVYTERTCFSLHV